MKTLSPDRWHQIDALLDEVLDLDAEARMAFLDRACADDPDLRRAVERLLASETKVPDFLSDQAVDFATPMLPDEPEDTEGDEAVAGRRVGPYRIVREIAHGGMGRVYLAERADGAFEQQVALKLLRVDAAEVRPRFQAERQILASLSHPHIAQLFDGGVTDDGRPYLAMEYVAGDPVDTYCDAHQLSVRDRLHLVAEVGEAVHHAHRNLVVHRDLKPSNILVGDTEEGTPQVKLLDFGIAKLLDEDGAPGAAPLTQTGQRWMTPEYAAPEQVRGEAITTATDVYQLGVVLYELLAGSRPFDRHTGGTHAVERAILEVEPAKPSTAALGASEAGEVARIAEARATEPEKLRRTLHGDLDTIVLKALAKEPEARYASAEAFVEDIRRYLAGLPVEARRPTLGYRARRFVQRHRWGVAAAVAFALLLVGYAATLTVQSAQVREALAQARLEADKAEQVTAFMMGLFESNDPTEALGDTLSVRDVLEQAIVRAEAWNEQPAVKAQMLDLVGRVYLELGDYEQARPLLDEALAMRERLWGREHEEVAETLTNLGHLLRGTSDYDEAEAQYREALAIRRTVFGTEHPDVALSLGHVSSVLGDKGEYETAEALQQQALTMQRRLLGENHLTIASSLSSLALLEQEQGDFDSAEARYREVLAMKRQQLDPEHPEIAQTLTNLGNLLRLQRAHDEAETMLREALAIKTKVYGAEHIRTTATINNLGLVLVRKGDYEAAESLYREALATNRRLVGDDHPDVTMVLNNLATLFMADGRFDEAEPVLREVLALRRKRWPEGHPDVALSLNNLAFFFHRMDRFAEARPHYEEVIAINERLVGAEHPRTQSTKRSLAYLLFQMGDYAASEPLMLETYRVLEAEQGVEHERTQIVLERLVGLYEAWGRSAQADPYRALLIEAAPS